MLCELNYESALQAVMLMTTLVFSFTGLVLCGVKKKNRRT